MFGHTTYLFFELGWALPVLALQWVVGGRTLRRKHRVLLLAVLVPTLYLSIADAVAIAHGIWILHAARIVGLRIGDLPVEEAIFFLLTNLMVAQSLVLVSGWRSRTNARTIRDYHDTSHDAKIMHRFDRGLRSR